MSEASLRTDYIQYGGTECSPSIEEMQMFVTDRKQAKEIKDLKAEIERLKELSENIRLDNCKKDASLKLAVDGFLKYGECHRDCITYPTREPCDCGFENLKKEIKGV